MTQMIQDISTSESCKYMGSLQSLQLDVEYDCSSYKHFSLYEM